jgi:rfaE bifunctional protein kinase chain/domain
MNSSKLTAESRPAVTSLPLTKSNLRKRIQALSGGKVIVLGDLLIDELLEGKPERISREAPVLILEHVDTQLIPGGAANTANNIVAVGGSCHAIGVCGQDEYARKMSALFTRAGITHDLVEDRTRPTTVKTRILSKSHSFRQQLLRLDRISHEPIGAQIEQRLIEKLEQVASQYQALVLSDYKGGVISDQLISACKTISARHNLKLMVDAQNLPERFQGVYLITPNQPDAEEMVGFKIDSNQSLKRAGQLLLSKTGAQAILITRGAQGMALFTPGQDVCELPVFNRSEVFDVSGAGDTVIATMALALVTGATYMEAMALGNLAAGIVVKKPGTATTNQDEMQAALDNIQLPE